MGIVRIFTAGLVVAGALSLLVATAASAAPARGGRPTNVNVVQPFQPDGGLKPRFRVMGSVRGACFAGSVADQSRPEAWRCSAGNAILDPCISNNNRGTRLVCMRSPWVNQVVVLRLTKRLPLSQGNKDQSPEGQPWGVQLASRELCDLETGAEGIVHGKPITYNCVNRGVILGQIDQRRPIWQAWFKREVDSVRVIRVNVRVAWY